MSDSHSDSAGDLALITGQLAAAGYFRARLAGLSPFDMLTGGLAWCIAIASGDADIDLLYDDDASLGEKIKVGEAIEVALKRMDCPHSLQAHQIQGLDYPGLLPVVLWLVKKVASTRKERAAQLRSYAEYKFVKTFGGVGEIALNKAVQSETFVPRRVFRPRRNLQEPPLDFMRGLELTLLEYGNFPSRLQIAESEDVLEKLGSFLEAAPPSRKSNRVSQEGRKEEGGREREMPIFSNKYKKEEELASLRAARENVSRRKKKILAEISANQEALKKQEEEREELEREKERIREELVAAGLEEELREAVGHIEHIEKIKAEKTKFRSFCRAEKARMEEELDRWETATSAAEKTKTEELERAYQEELLTWQSLRETLYQVCDVTSRMKRKLEDMPSRSELVQYERRFTELYELVEKKHGEMRRLFSSHNALADSLKLTQKEISLLDSILNQFNVAMNSPITRAKFLGSLQDLATGVQQMLNKSNAKLEYDKMQLKETKEKYDKLVANQRAYFETVREFQEECSRGEKLRSLVQSPRTLESPEKP